MDLKPYLQAYERAIDIPHNLEQEKKTLLLGQQLKVVRDRFCRRAKSHEKVLEAQYAYIISYLNHRHRLWQYDYMTFPRRVGELWESFCKASFKNSRNISRHYNPPKFDSVRKDLTRRKVPPIVWDIVGDVNLRTDGMFYCNKRLHVIDLKSSFNSQEKGNFQRLRTVGAVYKLWRPKSRRFVIVREDDGNGYLKHLSDYWEVKCGDAAYETIKELTSVDLKTWINENIDFKRHLDGDLYSYLERRELTKYLVW